MAEVKKVKNMITISIEREIHAKLNALGKRGETFSDIIRRLL